MATLTDWVITAGSILLLIVVTGSWLASIPAQNPTKIISSRWFALPPWAQIILGLAGIAWLIGFGFLLWIPVPLRLSESGATSLRSIGLGIFLIGLLLTLWARWALGAMYGVSTGSFALLKEKHHLVQRGPYAFIRHPMYLGYWLLLVGVTAVYRTWTPLLLLAMGAVSFYRRAQREEAALENAFGAVWHAYQARTGRFLPRWN